MHKYPVGVLGEGQPQAATGFLHPDGKRYREVRSLEMSDPELHAHALRFVGRRLPAPRPASDLTPCGHTRAEVRIDGNGQVVCTTCSPLCRGEKSSEVKNW